MNYEEFRRNAFKPIEENPIILDFTGCKYLGEIHTILKMKFSTIAKSVFLVKCVNLHATRIFIGLMAICIYSTGSLAYPAENAQKFALPML